MPCKSEYMWDDCQTLYDLAMVGIKRKDYAMAVHDCLTRELSTQEETPVLYTVDDHSEIWQYHKQKSYPFNIYTELRQHVTSGRRTFCLIAHPLFELNLKPEFQGCVKPVQPFPWPIFQNAILPDNSTFGLPASWQDDSQSLRFLAEVTGRFPGEMEALNRSYSRGDVSTPMEWLQLREAAMGGEFIKFLKEPGHWEKQVEFVRLLELIFSLAEEVDWPAIILGGLCFHKCGLFYLSQEDSSRFQCISLPARRVLLAYFKTRLESLRSTTSQLRI